MPDADAELSRPSDVTRLLNSLAGGRAEDSEGLSQAVYRELRLLAGRSMAGERADHTLQATALVNEAYLRLVRGPDLEWESRRHFYAAAAEAMRRVLIEHARSRGRQKRGGGWRRTRLDAVEMASGEDSGELLALDEAIGRLQEVDGRAAEIVRLRFYAGLDVEQTALAAGVSRRTVLREWAYAKSWLFRALDQTDPQAGEST